MYILGIILLIKKILFRIIKKYIVKFFLTEHIRNIICAQHNKQHAFDKYSIDNNIFTEKTFF